MTGFKEEPGKVVPLKAPKNRLQHATPLHKLTFTELVKELWGPERLEMAAGDRAP